MVVYLAKLLGANAERSLMAHPRCRDGSSAQRTPAPVWTALSSARRGRPADSEFSSRTHQPDRAVTSTMRATWKLPNLSDSPG